MVLPAPSPRYRDHHVLVVKTHLVQPHEDLGTIVDTYLLPVVQPQDTVFISEKVVAITQGRLVHAIRIRPRLLARVLSTFVTRNPAGMGIRRPVVMEMALREAGSLRILLAAAC